MSSNGLNKVMLIGNLGADPELRMTQSGTACLKMRLACSETYTDKAGEKQQKTEWVSCVLWGKRGEALHRFLEKGKSVFIEGKLSTSSYEKDGQKVYKTEVNVTEIILLGGGSGERREPRQDPSDPPRNDPNKGWNGAPAQSFPAMDDDLPF